VKITVTPDKGDGPVDSLADLGALIDKARATAAGAGADPGSVKARVRVNLTQTVKQVELSW
jgi:hypothetical protein